MTWGTPCLLLPCTSNLRNIYYKMWKWLIDTGAKDQTLSDLWGDTLKSRSYCDETALYSENHLATASLLKGSFCFEYFALPAPFGLSLTLNLLRCCTCIYSIQITLSFLLLLLLLFVIVIIIIIIIITIVIYYYYVIIVVRPRVANLHIAKHMCTIY